MEVVLFDCETNGLDYSVMHCIAVAAPRSKPILFTDMGKFKEWCDKNTTGSTIWVAHNACGFDYWAVNELTDVTIGRHQIVDTSVLSKLKDYNRFQTHSLNEMGTAFGCPKTEYTGGWEHYTPTMGSYCCDDVEVLDLIWSYCKDTLDKYPDACNTEHEVSLISAEMQRNGFKFNLKKAEELLNNVTEEMNALEADMKAEWPAELTIDRTIQWRTKDDGTPYSTCIKAMDKAPKWERKGDELTLYKYKEFNPASSKDRVDKLWDSGWKPYDKTKGHFQFERDRRKRWRR